MMAMKQILSSDHMFVKTLGIFHNNNLNLIVSFTSSFWLLLF